MALLYNIFEGQTNGDQVTVSNSDDFGGSALSYIFYNNGSFPAGNANVVYSTSAAMAGSMGCRLTLGTSTTYIAWEVLSGVGNRTVVRRPIRFATNPTASATLFVLRNSTGIMAQAVIRTTGQVRVADAAAFITASDFQLSASDTLYWMEVAVTTGSTTSDGRIELKVYSADGITEIWSYDSGATRNTGTTLAQVCRFAANTSASGWTYDDLDEIQWDTNKTSGFIGKYAPSNVAPSVSLSTSKSTLFPGEVATLTASASDGDGTIVSQSVSCDIGGILAGTWPNYTLTAPASLTDQTATATAGATDDLGATTTATQVITLKASMSKVYNGATWDPLIEYVITS